MATHNLKTIQPYFEAAWNKTKTFEVRKNDRDFKEGDTVILQEYDPQSDSYTGREISGTIQYILRDFSAIEDGYVVFSFYAPAPRIARGQIAYDHLSGYLHN